MSPTISDSLGDICRAEMQQPTSYLANNASQECLKWYLLRLSANKEQYELISSVVSCESGWDNSRRGALDEIGLAQFRPGTWEYFNKLRGTNLNIYNPYHQISMIVWGFNNSLEPHWVCWKLVIHGAISVP